MVMMREGVKVKGNEKKIMNHIFSQEHKYNYAYFAGWADGDGCFTPKEDPAGPLNYCLRIRNEEPVYNLSDLFLSSVILSTPEKRPWINESDPRKYTTLSGVRFEHFCKKVAPFLIEKQQLAINGLRRKGIQFNCSYKQHNRDEFFAYLAGFAEAEGHFRYDLKRSNYQLEITNYNKDSIDFIEENIKKYLNINIYRDMKKNGGNWHERKGFKPSQDKTNRISFIGNKKAVPVIKEILPYMMIDYKIETAKKIINHKYKN